mmetsp:Transcript_13150/g.19917  ORF Transcript_13150/g.19917 Transcript_13150/m.19917 type:complete len:364 (+) Transcript_13150:1999-3090(+)
MRLRPPSFSFSCERAFFSFRVSRHISTSICAAACLSIAWSANSSLHLSFLASNSLIVLDAFPAALKSRFEAACFFSASRIGTRTSIVPISSRRLSMDAFAVIKSWFASSTAASHLSTSACAKVTSSSEASLLSTAEIIISSPMTFDNFSAIIVSSFICETSLSCATRASECAVTSCSCSNLDNLYDDSSAAHSLRLSLIAASFFTSLVSCREKVPRMFSIDSSCLCSSIFISAACISFSSSCLRSSSISSLTPFNLALAASRKTSMPPVCSVIEASSSSFSSATKVSSRSIFLRSATKRSFSAASRFVSASNFFITSELSLISEFSCSSKNSFSRPWTPSKHDTKLFPVFTLFCSKVLIKFLI